MKLCRQCSAELPDEAVFCSNCGAQQSMAEAEPVQSREPVEEVKVAEVEPVIEEVSPQINTEEEVITQVLDVKKAKPVKKKEPLKNKEILNKSGSDLYLFLGLLVVSVVPGILESLIMLFTKQSLGQFIVFILEFGGLIGGLILLSIYLSTLKNGIRTRDRIITAGSGILWMYVMPTISLLLLDLLESFAFANVIKFYWIYYIVFVGIVFVTLVAMSRILSRTVHRLTVANPGKLMRRPKLFWRTLLLLATAFFLIPDLMVILFSGEFIPLPLSFVGTVTEWVATVYLQVILIKLTIEGIVKATDSDGFASEEKTNPKLQKIMPIVAIGLMVAILIYDLLSTSLVSTLDSIEANIQNDMSLGSYYMAAGDIEMAMEMYDIAYVKTQGWLAFVGDDPNALRQVYKSNEDNEQLEYLTAVKYYTVQDLERVIFEDKSTADWYHLLLDAYKAQESNKENPLPLTERQEIIRKDLLNTCIASQMLINSNIRLKDVEGKEKKITQALNPYIDFIEQYGVYRILNEVSKSGGMNASIMNQLLTYAEENREDIIAQYMAYNAGRKFLYDGAPHYQRTAEATIRFRELYLEQLDTKEDIQVITRSINMEVAETLMELQDYGNAVIYFEEAADLGLESSARLLAARCYDALENFDKSLEMAAIAISENDNDYEALNVAMTSALKVGKVTESLGYAASLLNIMSSLEGNEFLMVDADMYIYVQYLTVSDQTQWTPLMKYQVYPDLDEDQLAILAENPLLDHYVKALYYTFGGRDFELAWTHADALVEEFSESAQIQYLAGTIHFNKREFEPAVKYYTASLEIDDTAPSVWYALANAYDAMEDYQEAYNCTLEVAELLQYNNHAVDIYGVQVHNERLMSSLASKIEEGGN